MLYQRLPPALYSLLVAYTVAISGMCIAYDVVVMNAVLLMPDFLDMANTTKQETLAFLSTVLLIAAAIGTLPSAWLADKIGRRAPISLGALLYVVGTGVQLGANKRAVTLAGRAISGFGVGFMALCCSLYTAEMATSSNRGMLTSLQQFFQVKGVLIAAFVVYTATKDNFGEEKQWKMPLGVSIGPGAILMVLIWLMPESPRWLMMQGREEEAIHALAKFHSRGDVKDPYVCAQAADIKAACISSRAQGGLDVGCISSRAQGGALRSIFRTKAGRKRFAIGSLIAASAQVTGQSLVQYYQPALYRALNFSLKRTLLFQCAHAGVGLVGTLFAIALMDRLGRRFLAVSSMAVCAIGLAGAMITIEQWPIDSRKEDRDTGHYAHLGFTWLFYFAFNAGIGPVTYTYATEIFNTPTRSLGSGFILLTSFFANFMITQGASKGFEKLSWKYFLIFLILASLNGIFLLLGMPETRGRTLEEMDAYWSEEGEKRMIVLCGRGDVKVGRREREMELRSGLVRRLQVESLGLELKDSSRA